MSFGSPDPPDPPPPLPAAPVRVLPDIKKAKLDLRERLKRARSRQLSIQTTPALLNIVAPTVRPVLSDLLA